MAIREGDPVTVVYPDQGEGGLGTVLIPNTVALVKGRPHPGGRRRPAALARLRGERDAPRERARRPRSRSARISAGAELPAHVKRPGTDFRATVVDWQKVGENRDRWLDYLNERFRPAP